MNMIFRAIPAIIMWNIWKGGILLNMEVPFILRDGFASPGDNEEDDQDFVSMDKVEILAMDRSGQ